MTNTTNPTPLAWETVRRRVNDLIPQSTNPRKISEAKRMKLIESLQRFNLVDLPVIDHDGTIVSGHQRLRALQAIGRGEEEIEVRHPNRQLTDKERKEYTIMANQHFGEWDAELLSDFTAADVDLDDMGFSLDDFHLPDEPEEEKHLEAEEDNYEVPEVIHTDIVRGDLFEFRKGDLRHRLLCGDSTSVDDWDKLMGGKTGDMLLTDPPYGVKYVGKTKDALTIKNDALTNEETHNLWNDALTSVLLNLKNGGAIYATVPQGLLQVGFMKVMLDHECLRQCMVWDKGSMVLGHSDYQYEHEPILYGWKPNGAHYFISDRTKTTVLRYTRPNRNDLHPTMKPIELWAELIQNSSLLYQIILDSFLGSGTTMVAAHQLGRNCYGMELDEKYCQVIVDRMRALDPEIEVYRNGERV